MRWHFKITSLMTVYSTVYSDADQRKHQSSTSLAFVREIHQWLVNSPQKGPVMWKMFPLDDVVMGIKSIDWWDAFRKTATPQNTMKKQMCIITNISLYSWPGHMISKYYLKETSRSPQSVRNHGSNHNTTCTHITTWSTDRQVNSMSIRDRWMPVTWESQISAEILMT